MIICHLLDKLVGCLPPGGIISSTSAGFGILHDQDMEDTSSTDENEFSFTAVDQEEEIIINETDV